MLKISKKLWTTALEELHRIHIDKSEPNAKDGRERDGETLQLLTFFPLAVQTAKAQGFRSWGVWTALPTFCKLEIFAAEGNCAGSKAAVALVSFSMVFSTMSSMWSIKMFWRIEKKIYSRATPFELKFSTLFQVEARCEWRNICLLFIFCVFEYFHI